MPTESHDWRVRVGDAETSVAVDAADSAPADGVFICAHGAGGHMNDRAMLALSKTLRARGVSVVRFNFVYREKKSARPDPMPQLLKCWTVVADHVRRELAPKTLVIGGRSMGGRAASMLAAEDYACDGVLLLAYPLHPPGQPEKLRTAHLASIKVPVLCFNGTRDPFCDPELMTAALGNVGSNWTMHWLEGADHSFHVLKRSGTTDAEVLARVGDTARDWMATIR